jgi:hypothetical protein
MIEVSITEIGLFAWAILATGFALKYKHDYYAVMHTTAKILSDSTARETAVKQWADLESRRNKEEV